jgi:diguanylate cyclase (GGDEF)-like protein/PAS domain S-box-containing protein
MENNKNKLLNICFFTTACIGAVIIFASLSVYFGIIYNNSTLTNISSNMNLNSATCFFLTGSALLIMSKQNPGFIIRIILDVISIGILLISILTIYQYMSGVDLGIDQLVSNNFLSSSQSTLLVGRIPFLSAINFILIAFAFIFSSRKLVPIWIVQTFVFLVIILTLFGLFDYFYSNIKSHGHNITSQAALLFLMTCTGILLTKPYSGIVAIFMQDNNSGYLLRRAVPIPIICTVLIFSLGWFLEERGKIDLHDILALVGASIFAMIGITTVFASITLNRKESQLKESKIQMQQNEIIFRQFTDNIDIVFYTTSPDLSQLLYVSPAYEKIWGKSAALLYKNPKEWFESILPEDKKRVEQVFYTDFSKGGYSASAEYRIQRPDGSIRYILSRIYRIKDENNNIFSIIGIAIDLTRIKLYDIYNQIDIDILSLIETEKNIEGFNPKFLKMMCRALHWDLGELWLLDKSKHRLRCVDIWHENDELLNNFNKKSCQFTFGLGEGLPGRIWKEQQVVWISDYASTKAFSRSNEARVAGLKSVLAVPIRYQKKFFGVIEFFSKYALPPDSGLSVFMENVGIKIGDFISHTYTVKQINEISRYDALTKLLNRSAFEEDLDELIAVQNPKSLAVIMLDIDRFNLINAAYGHKVGDTLLNLIAMKLSKFSDPTLVNKARLGADKFILYFVICNRNDAYDHALSLNRIFTEPFELNDCGINISATLGIAIYPEDGLDSKSLVLNADLAMIQAKDQGGNRINFFTKDLPFIASKKIVMEIDLREAINGDQFILAFQPQVDLKSGNICAAEVLVRWQHPKNGLIYPGAFIPYAEKSEMIVLLNEYIMRKVFQQISLIKLDIPVSINISAQQFNKGFHIVEYLESLMKEYSITAKQIELEIVENMLMKNTEHNMAVLTAIHELGFQIAIDDFGTGFSSFSYLKRLPARKIKMDKSFISGLPVDLENAQIVKALIPMLHSLNKIVVAEGAETKAEIEFLMQEKCDLVQGFYYYKPMSLEALIAIIAKANNGKNKE